MDDDSVTADATSAVPQPRLRMTPPRYGDGEPIPKDTIRDAMPGVSRAEVDRVFQWIAHRSAELYDDDLEAGRLKATTAERHRVARRVEERRMGLERATILARREARRAQRRVLVAPQPARDAGSSRPRERRSSGRTRRRGPPTADEPSDDPPRLEPLGQAEVGSGDTGLNIVWGEAMARLETVDEFLELANVALRRTEWLLEIGWGRRAA